jgi:hypothetical protein
MPQSPPDIVPSNLKTSLGPEPSESFEDALHVLLLAWKAATHPQHEFPIDKVCFHPIHKSPLAPQPNATQDAHQVDRCLPQGVIPTEEEGVTPSSATHDARLPSGVIVANVPSNCSLVVKNDLSRFRRDRAIVDALKKVMALKKNQPTNHARHLLGAFAASFTDGCDAPGADRCPSIDESPVGSESGLCV